MIRIRQIKDAISSHGTMKMNIAQIIETGDKEAVQMAHRALSVRATLVAAGRRAL